MALGAAAAPAAAQELALVRLGVPSRAALDSVRRMGIDIVTASPVDAGGYRLIAVVGTTDRLALAAAGFPPEDLPRPPEVQAMEAARSRLGARGFTVYRDFDDAARGVAAYVRSFAQARSNMAVESIGASVQGRPILAVKIGPAADSPARPNVIYVSTYHAREWAATETALRFMAWLADSLPSTAQGAQLLAARDVWVIPVANPDGYQYTFDTTRLWRKNRRPNADGTFGVDMNRNHAGFFALDNTGSSPVPGSEVYRGTSAESEPETQAIAAFHRAHPPVVAITYHTFTGSILYPWGHVDGALTGDDPVFRALAGTGTAPAMADSVPGSNSTVYHPGPGWQLYPTNGDYADWAYREFGTAAFTLELTNGCCIGGLYYGFEFPDDDALLERVFRDQLPFALNLLEDAADLSRASGPSGVAVNGARFESVWPEVRVIVPASSANVVLNLAASATDRETIVLAPDSLGVGRYFRRFTAGGATVTEARAFRVATAGLVAEVLTRDGAERADSPWSGFGRTGPAFEGDSAWFGNQDTLFSPAIPVAGRSGIALSFWNRHNGSLFDPGLRGRVEVSTDGGASWTEVHRAVGSAAAFYPVAVPLPMAEGRPELLVRFIAENLSWHVDAIAVTAGETTLFDAGTGTQVAAQVETSANPVRVAPVTLRWPAGTGSARVDLFSMLGTRIAGENQQTDAGRWVWDLLTSAGAPVANGVYYVIVTRADGTRLRRRLFVAR